MAPPNASVPKLAVRNTCQEPQGVLAAHVEFDVLVARCRGLTGWGQQFVVNARRARVEGFALDDESDFGHDVVSLFGAAPCLGEYVAYAQCGLAHDPCRSDGR